MGKLTQVPLDQIVENEVALRSVKRDSEQYQGLVASMKERGFMGAITARQIKTPDGKTVFELMDGLQRFNAAKDAGLKTINVDVVELDKSGMLEAQILLNMHRIETRPVEYSKQLVRLLSLNPTLTIADLAKKLGKSVQWVGERLSLVKIKNEKVQELINSGKIPLSNAYALAKLPEEEIPNYVAAAQNEAPDKFIPACAARQKEIKEAKRKGKTVEEAKFAPVAFMQSLKDVKTECESGKIGRALVSKYKVTDAVAAFQLGVKWCLHLDPESVAAQQAKFEQAQKERAEAAQKRQAERAAAKAEKAEKEAEEAKKAANEAAKVLESKKA